MNPEKFIFCLEGVEDTEDVTTTNVLQTLEHMAVQQGITSAYKTCDTIEGFEESLNVLLYEDHNFSDYEIIYLVMPGDANSICLNDFHYNMQEIAELFEGKMKGKVIHFANKKILDLTDEECQYFIDVTGARAVSGYGVQYDRIPSYLTLDKAFFTLLQQDDDLKNVVEELFKRHYDICRALDFRLYH